ncbi:MAG TPA: hypothetical protein DIT13_16295 [Verrucomicrobiales bacterium]|nr:hypothetical protein [Verrucomicrobiales bacterium]HRJ10319.1 DUF3592 domain-containing protein [Prosthecobacter sp.]HRK13777.1 DUF3592 domain-containing protein [Prosthecobacter sp.]
MSSSAESTLAGRVWLACMGLFIAAAGLLFTCVLWTSWQRAEETRRWTPLPCRIVSARVVSEKPTPNSNPAHKAEIRYEYTFQGKPRTGTRIKRVDAASQHEERARQKLEAWPVGTEAACFVNPAAPDEAVLAHDTRAALYSIWFPLLFVFGGFGMAWNALRPRPANTL